jgi:hypothetical protein
MSKKYKDNLFDIRYLKYSYRIARSFLKKLLVLPFYNSLVIKIQKTKCTDIHNKYYLSTDHVGDTFIALSILENSKEYFLEKESHIPIIYKGYEDLMFYFPRLSQNYLTWGDEKTILSNSKELAEFNGIITLSSKFKIIIGIKERVKYKNLKVLGYKFKHINEFIRNLTVREELYNARIDNYFKFILGLPFSIPTKLLNEKNYFSPKSLNFIKQHGLIERKTVILSPYSNSALHSRTSENIMMFEKIAKLLNSKGYMVCTNVDIKNPIPIKGTIPISPSLDIIVDVAELCGYVIAYRSGFTDLVANSNAKIFVYYPKMHIFPNIRFYNYTSLSKIYDRPDIVEIEGDMEKFVEIVKNSF